MTSNVKLHRLANGMRVVTEYMPGLESAAIGIWVGAGGRHEAPDQNGIAHFLEHMAFKGTERRTALQIAEEIEDVGGYINAYTSREVTAYYARVLKDDVPLAFDLISDILLNPIFDSREIEVERGVILQEIGQSLDTPDDIVFDWLQETAYPDQPLGRTILGPAERVRSFDRSDLERFVNDNYGPEEMILSAAGAVDHEALVKLAEATFGALSPRKQKTLTPATFLGGELIKLKELEQAHVTIGFEQPSYRDDAVYTSQISAAVLGGGMSSRLFQELREKRGLCYTVFAQVGPFVDTGMLTIYAGTAQEDVQNLVNVTVDELRRAADDLTQVEVSRAKAQMKAGMLMGLESPSSRAERMARVVAIWDRVPDLAEVIERVDSVDRVGVADHLAELRDQRPALTSYGPVQEMPHLEAVMDRLSA